MDGIINQPQNMEARMNVYQHQNNQQINFHQSTNIANDETEEDNEADRSATELNSLSNQ
jgi:hypothetical protein